MTPTIRLKYCLEENMKNGPMMVITGLISEELKHLPKINTDLKLAMILLTSV